MSETVNKNQYEYYRDKLFKFEEGKVEWKTLGEVCEIGVGSKPEIIYDKSNSYEYINAGTTNSGYCSYYNCDGDTITTPSRGQGGIGFIGYMKERFWLGPLCYKIKAKKDINILSKYIYYFLKENNSLILALKKEGGVPAVNRGDLINLNIPIPPLHIQEEIVCILDIFTELTAELIAELTARKKQYEYYRDKLLTFEEGQVEWRVLGKVTLPTSNIRWRDTNDTYRYIDLTSVCRDKNIIIETTEISAENAPSRAQKLVAKDDVIFATTRPTQQRLCLITEEYSGEVASTGYCILRAKKEVLPKWIYYFITSTRFKKYVEENQSGSAYPAISDAKVKEFNIPIPPLAEQERIVSILDKFDALTNSITEGLPREIELRQKQYEYYRNMLLSFPKQEV